MQHILKRMSQVICPAPSTDEDRARVVRQPGRGRTGRAVCALTAAHCRQRNKSAFVACEPPPTAQDGCRGNSLENISQTSDLDGSLSKEQQPFSSTLLSRVRFLTQHQAPLVHHFTQPFHQVSGTGVWLKQ